MITVTAVMISERTALFKMLYSVCFKENKKNEEGMELNKHGKQVTSETQMKCTQ